MSKVRLAEEQQQLRRSPAPSLVDTLRFELMQLGRLGLDEQLRQALSTMLRRMACVPKIIRPLQNALAQVQVRAPPDTRKRCPFPTFDSATVTALLVVIMAQALL